MRRISVMRIQDFKSLMTPLQNKLYRFSLRIVGNTAEAEDVVQEVLIKMWKKRTELSAYKNLEAWCMTLTRNLSIDKLRSKHRRTSELQDGLQVVDKSVTPFQHAAYQDTLERVRRLMAELPEKQRMVMQLRDIEGMTYQEIAEALSISMEQVKVNLFRARKQIRAKLINSESYGL